jgi:hypothetical protein
MTIEVGNIPNADDLRKEHFEQSVADLTIRMRGQYRGPSADDKKRANDAANELLADWPPPLAPEMLERPLLGEEPERAPLPEHPELTRALDAVSGYSAAPSAADASTGDALLDELLAEIES